MAHKKSRVFLGFDDEVISEKYRSQVNFTTNKIGGNPDWPVDSVTAPLCKLCGLSLPLLLQIYAPLDNSPYHRTLYLFCCINPNCWNQSESWICLRSQIMDGSSKEQSSNASAATSVALGASDWCAEADDWDEDAENGNVAPNKIEILRGGDDVVDDFEGDHSCNACTNSGSLDSADDADDDWDIDGQSTEMLSSQLGSLRVDSVAQRASQRDANFNASWRQGSAEGARGNLHSPQASAEIEGDESELVMIDTPTGPQRDLHALLQESAPLPNDIRNPQFSSVFITVLEESRRKQDTEMSAHVQLLLSEYEQNQDHSLDYDGQEAGCGSVGGGGGDCEKYERSMPAHGDMLFHQFLERIQQTPGQILRYCREGGSPLPIAPLVEIPSSCPNCQSDMVFELQVLPSIISKLRLQLQNGELVNGTHVEFGTVLLWTCRQSCWATGDNVREEKVIVQAERM